MYELVCVFCFLSRLTLAGKIISICVLDHLCGEKLFEIGSFTHLKIPKIKTNFHDDKLLLFVCCWFIYVLISLKCLTFSKLFIDRLPLPACRLSAFSQTKTSLDPPPVALLSAIQSSFV